MFYGGVYKYKYTTEVPRLTKTGGFAKNKDGEVLTEKIEKTIFLAFNAVTFLLYKNFTSHDLMQDFLQLGAHIGKEDKKQKELLEKAQNNINELTEQEIDKLAKINVDSGIEFLINITAAMIATCEYPTKREFFEIVQDLPLNVLSDPKFIEDVMQIISFGLKKNIQ